jgi:hypothetical protein
MARRPPNLCRYWSYSASALSSWHRADVPSPGALPPPRPARRGANFAAHGQAPVKVGELIKAIITEHVVTKHIW